jgi:hypothetical protein
MLAAALPRLASGDLDAERRTVEVATGGAISPTSRSAALLPSPGGRAVASMSRCP